MCRIGSSFSQLPSPRRFAGVSPDFVEVCFNLKFLLHYGQSFIDLVVPHEVAHLVMYFCYPGTSGHGSYWREIMRNICAPIVKDFGFDPSIALDECYEYVCSSTCGRVHKVSKRKHNNIQKGVRYSCPHCNSSLKLSVR